ncbi:MAG: hypothetical protein CL946_00295 [Ectothiorhodospiraceae bacterium]|nr:hypothetical protein [Ectothiorhodospiraceae bacterium]
MKNAILPIASCLIAALFVIGCSSDAVTDALAVTYGEDVSITVEKESESKYTCSGEISVIVQNRTDRAMNLQFQEATILDPETMNALVRFRPIIPQAHGALSTVEILSRQTIEIPIVTPLDLYGFNPNKHRQVLVQVNIGTTGYRTSAISQPINVQVK